jgi:hypothetical protein
VGRNSIISEVANRGDGWKMAKSNDDLVKEINELRSEMKQMRELLNMLFTIVVEQEEDEEDDYGFPMLSQDTPRFNN